jgi:hypothetical protein
MSNISVDVTDNKTFVTVEDSSNSVTIDRSDNPITVETSLAVIGGNASTINVAAYKTIFDDGTVQSALEKLADQSFRGTTEPTAGTANLEEGDLFYDTDDDQLKVYRETSPDTFEFVPLASATGTMDILDAGSF